MAKRFSVPAGQRTRILWIFSSSIPGTVRFTAETPAGGDPSGTVTLSRRRWLASDTTHHPLHRRNVFDKGFADADYRIYVTPDQDCEIAFETRHVRAEIYFRLLAGILILGLIAAMTAWIFAPPVTPGGT